MGKRLSQVSFITFIPVEWGSFLLYLTFPMFPTSSGLPQGQKTSFPQDSYRGCDTVFPISLDFGGLGRDVLIFTSRGNASWLLSRSVLHPCLETVSTPAPLLCI